MSVRNPEPIDGIVGKHIRLRRLSKGLSQTELGKRVGVTFQQVQKYEKGVNRVGASRLLKIAEVLEVPVSYFFEGADYNETTSDVESPLSLIAEPQALRLVQAFSGINNTHLRRSLVELVERIAAAGPAAGPAAAARL
jgi:transcriptional regulator with XRE-family HTH domain